ncbi:MAG: DNA repair exonuclease [Vulcanimicrobiota bacterium]
MRFLHAADLHLDSPLRGLSRYHGAPEETLRGATRRALINLVDEALKLQVDFLLLAGDLYDGDWPDYNTGLFFTAQMARLNHAGIPVVAICGNHDAQSKITKGLRLPPNVRMLSVEKPETVTFEEIQVAVHGQGFKSPAVWDDLTTGYPNAHPGAFNIGLLHTGLEGRPGHASYAPCTLDGLKRLGYHYWALGHIHQREILCQDPYVVYPGNLQGRHARETGSKGATLVTVCDGVVETLQHLALDVVRWTQIEIDITALRSTEEVLRAAERALQEELEQLGGLTLAARILTTGHGPTHAELIGHREYWVNEMRNLGVQMGQESVWVEKVQFRSNAALDLEKVASQHDAFSSLLDGLRDLSSDEEQLRILGEELFSELERKLPLPWKNPETGGLSPASLVAVKEALGDVGHILATHLSECGENLR